MTTLATSGKAHIEQTFKELDLSNQELMQKEFDGCRFINCNFSEAKFNKCRFCDCEFINCNLSLISVKDCTFIDTVFESCKIIGVNWTQAAWPQIKLCAPLQFFKCTINYSSFLGLYLREIAIVECTAHDVDFREADLTQADFSQTDLTKSLFVKTNLTKANFSYANNYSINVYANEIKRAKFMLPEAANLLYGLDIELVEP